MTQVAFSHQFSHRWSNAPEAVKNALLQEFDDIVRLLDNDTDLETFKFSQPDLKAYIDTIYTDIAAEQQTSLLEAERLEAQQIEAERLEAERLEAEKEVAEKAEAEKVDTDNDSANLSANLEATMLYDEQLAFKKQEQRAGESESTADNSNLPIDPNTSYGMTSSMASNATTTPPNFAFETTQGELNEAFIKELESRIDDYLSEQLATMSEDLKSWLRDQVNARLGNK